MKVHPSVVAIPLLFTVCSCSDAADFARSSVRDSAGIRVVENQSPAWEAGAEWRIGPEPSMDLGGPNAAPEFQFQQLSHFAVFANGNFAVADRTTRQVHFFTPAGEVIAVRGGEGGGPGEFRSISGMTSFDDRVFAYDPHAARLTVFDSSGGFLEVITLEEPAGFPALFSYRLVGEAAGKLLLSPRMFTPSPGGAVSVYRDSAPNLLFRADGGFEREVAEPSGVDMFVSVQGASSVPFSIVSNIAASGDRVFLNHGGAFEIRVFLSSGPLSQLARRSFSPVPVTEADLQRAIADHLAMAGASSPRDPRFEGFIRMMESAPLPETMPAMGRLMVDALGFTWCQHYRPTAERNPTRWSVFSSDGIWLGEVHMPAGFRPGVIGADFILGVYSDSLDVQHIWKLPLSRGPAEN